MTEPRPRTAADFDSLGNVWGLGGPHDQERLELTTRFIRAHVSDPAVIVECGALHGALTERLLDAFPRAAMHLIEIAPSHVAVLRERFSEADRVTVYETDMLALTTLPVPAADAVLLIECLYYLSETERHTFVEGLRRDHPAATVIVATPVTGGVYFTEPQLRRLFSGYDLVSVEVTLPQQATGLTRRVMDIARRLKVEATAARALRRRVAAHAIYAFAPSSR
jgi:hypothetical protein